MALADALESNGTYGVAAALRKIAADNEDNLPQLASDFYENLFGGP